MLLDVVEGLDDDRDVLVGEEDVGAGGCVVGIGRLEQSAGRHDAGLGEFVDDQPDEPDLGEVRVKPRLDELRVRLGTWRR